MKLVMFSGGAPTPNRTLGREVMRFFGPRSKPLITFIPADEQGWEEDYANFRRKFASRRVRFACLLIEKPLSAKAVGELLASDGIFLGGGNTFHFLDKLRKRGLITKLREFAAKGGLLMGLSAGSILLTPTIHTASVPSFDADENWPGVTNLTAMGLVNFEFSPHYLADEKADDELREHSVRLKRPIYACTDGSGLVVNQGKVRAVGSVAVFSKGRKRILQ
jgi:dipeptidase E